MAVNLLHPSFEGYLCTFSLKINFSYSGREGTRSRKQSSSFGTTAGRRPELGVQGKYTLFDYKCEISVSQKRFREIFLSSTKELAGCAS